MCKFIGKSNERILCKLSKSEILKLYSICHVAMVTTKMSDFTCQSKCFISIFFTCHVSASELQPFCCHDLANAYTDKLPKLCSATLRSVRMFVTARLRVRIPGAYFSRTSVSFTGDSTASQGRIQGEGAGGAHPPEMTCGFLI